VDRPPFAVVVHLYAIAEDRWAEIDAAYPSINVIRLAPHRFLNFVYAWAVARVDPEKREEFDMLLDTPVPGQERQVSETTREAEGAAFMALMSATQKE
jgi:hypothetical protein